MIQVDKPIASVAGFSKRKTKSRVELKKTKSIKVSEAGLNKILDTVSVGVAVTTPEGDISYVNDSLWKMFGFNSREEFSGTPFVDHYLDPRDRERLIELLKKGPVADFETQFKRKDGSLFLGSISSETLATETGKQIVNVFQDVSGFRKMEEELKKRVQGLQERDEMIRRISTPVIDVWEGIVMLPVVGILDSARAKQLTEAVLERISEQKTELVVILSIGGIAAIDTKTANHILRTVHAIKLMGSEMIITGIRPDVATTLVSLGIDLTGIVTRSTMREGLEYAFDKLGVKMTKNS